MNCNFSLHRIIFSNYYSFRDEAEISFISKDERPASRSFISKAGTAKLSNVVAITGQADTRRSNVVKAIVFVANLIAGNLQDRKKRCAHIRTNPLSKNKWSAFTIEFEFRQNLYRYTLKASVDNIFHEELKIKSSNFYSCVFTRRHIEYSQHDEIKTFDLELDTKNIKLQSEYKSILSFAAENGSQFAYDMVTSFSSLLSNSHVGQASHTLPSDVFISAKRLSNDKSLAKRVAICMAEACDGISSIELERIDYSANLCSNVMYAPIAVRANGSKTLLLFEERSVQSFFVLLERVLSALENGGIAIIDNIDTEIDPCMLKYLIGLFVDKRNNPNNAQLMFSAASLEILGCLQRSQIYYVDSIDSDVLAEEPL